MNFINNPKRLLLIDIGGAFITTLLLFLVVKNNNQVFGISSSKVDILAIIALFICCVGIVGCFMNKNNWKLLFITLASINLFYCLITVMVLISSENVTIYGMLYFLIEIVIILMLAFLEIKTALQISQK